MNREIATAIKSKIIGLPFVDLLGGLVQKITEMKPDQNNNLVRSSQPMAYDIWEADAPDICYKNNERSLVPNSARKSVIYMEDGGVRSVPKTPGITSVSSNIRIVCWLNRDRLVGDRYANLSTYCAQSIIAVLCGHNPFNYGNIQKLQISFTGMPTSDFNIFARYTYDEVVRQYLMPPFDCFALDLSCSFEVRTNCLTIPDFSNGKIC